MLFVGCLLLNLAQGIRGPETWFLQVVDRVTTGEVLYRDVFFGATPLSVYVTAPWVWLFGAEVMMVKAIIALCCVLIIFFSCRILGQLQAPPRSFLTLPLALLLLSYSKYQSLYSALATLFLLACWSAFLAAREAAAARARPETTRLGLAAWSVAAGGAAGLCFAAKQNVGIYALAALLVALTLTFQSGGSNQAQRFKCLGIVLGAFLGAAVLVLLPIFLSGGAAKFLEYGFTAKSTYLRFAGVSYFDGVRELVELVQLPRKAVIVRALYDHTVFLLPLLAFPALLLATIRSPRTRKADMWVVWCFVGAGFLALFPRAELHHMRFVAPPLAVGLFYCWQQFASGAESPRARRLGTGILIWATVGLFLSLLVPLVQLGVGTHEISRLPHFRGPLIRTSRQAEARLQAKSLSLAAQGKPVFLLTRTPGFYYLLSGIKNPTPFDIPLVTALGHQGEVKLMQAIAGQEIPRVCLGPPLPRPLAPLDLYGFVRRHMQAVQDMGFCTLYRVAP